MVEPEQLELFVAWAKRRGVIFPSSEIYGGLGSSYDYGPIGVEMKNRLKTAWWNSMVRERDDVVGLDSAIILNPQVWQASGHLDNFADPLVECLSCHRRYRKDDLLDLWKERNTAYVSEHHEIRKCPNCDGDLSEVKQFNTMFKTLVGPVEEDAATAYLRPETAQGTFVNFKQVMEVSRLSPPFGIAQIGKAFRNEITPGNFTFRTREFEQMELEFFVDPKEADEWFDYWVKARLSWYVELGLSVKDLRLKKHPKSQLAHYSKATTDIEYHFPWGWGELEGIANRGDYDLITHQKHSGKDLSVFDEKSGKKYHPWVIEPAGGVDRALLALMLDAWQHHETGRKGEGEPETVLGIDTRLSAYDAAVLPLVKKAPLVKLAEKLVAKLKNGGKSVFYDESGSIGRRYRRMDEIGTPVCYTIDFQSLEDNSVTERDRNSMEQKRIKIKEGE